MSEKLKPCPFCGCRNVTFIKLGSSSEGYAHMGVCDDCQAEGPAGERQETAVELWNARVGAFGNNLLANQIAKRLEVPHDERLLYTILRMLSPS